MTIGFQCAGCFDYFDWTTEQPVDSADAEIKTIGSRYCVSCIDAEGKAHGLSRDAVIEMRRARGRVVP